MHVNCADFVYIAMGELIQVLYLLYGCHCINLTLHIQKYAGWSSASIFIIIKLILDRTPLMICIVHVHVVIE